MFLPIFPFRLSHYLQLYTVVMLSDLAAVQLFVLVVFGVRVLLIMEMLHLPAFNFK